MSAPGHSVEHLLLLLMLTDIDTALDFSKIGSAGFNVHSRVTERLLMPADEGGLAFQWKSAWEADLKRALAAGVEFEEAVCAVASMTGDMALLKSTALVTGPGAYNLCSLGAAFG